MPTSQLEQTASQPEQIRAFAGPSARVWRVLAANSVCSRAEPRPGGSALDAAESKLMRARVGRTAERLVVQDGDQGQDLQLQAGGVGDEATRAAWGGSGGIEM
jgi:hypothetical protein